MLQFQVFIRVEKIEKQCIKKINNKKRHIINVAAAWGLHWSLSSLSLLCLYIAPDPKFRLRIWYASRSWNWFDVYTLKGLCQMDYWIMSDWFWRWWHFFFTINSLEWVSAMNSLVFSHPSLLSIFIFTFPPPSTKHASPSCSNIFAWNNIQNKLLLRMNREPYISSSVKYSLFFCCCCLSLRVVCCWLLLAGSDENAKCDSGLVSVIHFRNAKGAKLWFITLNLKNLLFKVGKVKMGMAVRWLSIKGKSYCMLFDWWVV